MMSFMILWLGFALSVVMVRRRIMAVYLREVAPNRSGASATRIDPLQDWHQSQTTLRLLHLSSRDPRIEALRRRAYIAAVFLPIIALATIFPAAWLSSTMDARLGTSIGLADAGVAILAAGTVTSLALLRSRRWIWQVVGVVSLTVVVARIVVALT